ncbi:MAG: hypothetical protein Kow0029_05300 [Candidatus Rifleibacteriota bacterium]
MKNLFSRPFFKMSKRVSHDNSEVFTEYLSRIDPDRLLAVLSNQSAPVWESEIMTELLPDLDIVSGSALELYRYHFVLFHQMYRLSDDLAGKGYYLHIHFMNIFLCKYPETGKCGFYFPETGRFCAEPVFEGTSLCSCHKKRQRFDAIEHLSDRYFYLDETNFFAVSQETAEKFLSGAWNLLCNYEDVKKCYEILELPENSDLKTVKLRFRLLAKQLHPDLNSGLDKKFAEINTAYRKLVNYITFRSFDP